MASKESSSQNQHCENDYDDDYDSDVESRLYAEIHFSNALSNHDHESSNSPRNNLDQETGSKNSESNVPNTGSGTQLPDAAKNVDNTATSDLPNAETQVNSETPQATQNASNSRKLNRTPKSSKRSLTNDDKKSNNTDKRRKLANKSNATDSPAVISASECILVNSSTPSSSREKGLQNDQSQIVNPYNKHVNNQQAGMKLLSPAFLHLFFKNKSRHKRKQSKSTHEPADQQRNNNVQQNTCISANSEEGMANTYKANTSDQANKHNEVHQSNVSKQANENEGDTSSDISVVIDISSESEDSVDNSKYSTTTATDKKLEKQQFLQAHANSVDSMSDSEESIYEIPIPPKPAPPVIELKDSDNERNRESENDSDSDSSSSNSSVSQMDVSQNKDKQNLNPATNSNDVYSIDSESDEPDNLILNCTVIQKGASSLSEIKRMSRQATCSSESTKENIAHNMGETETDRSRNVNMCNLENQQSESNNLPVNDKVTADKKIDNTLNNKRRSKSCPSRNNIPLEQYFFQPMTDKMKAFYNDSWGGENFDMDKLKNQMSSDPKKWAILDTDLVLSAPKRRRYFGMVCTRCQKEGHRQNQCPQPFKVPTCHMCGLQGHYETGCPHKKCLTCGARQALYRKTCEFCERMCCSRCNSRGHMEYSCPDLWRRYHQTTSNAHAEVPRNLKKLMKPQHELFCCNCAKRGHESSACRKLRWSQHFPNPAYIINYAGPAYFLENHREPPQSTNDAAREISPNTSSANLDFTLDDTINLNTSNERSPDFPRSRNSTGINLNTSNERSPDFPRSRNSAGGGGNAQESPRGGVVFHVKSKTVDESRKGLKKFTLKFNAPDENYNNWKGLAKFLDAFAASLSAEFLLEEKHRRLQMMVSCHHKYVGVLTKFIEQFAGRNNFERSSMYICFNRDSNRVAAFLDGKMQELREKMEDPLKLYEEVEQLAGEAAASGTDDRSARDLRNSIRLRKLAVHQEKLLLALYNEGFADNSLQRLHKLYTKMKTKIRGSMHAQKANYHQRSISVKCLFEYLYYYNNVFVPYQPKNLSTFINKYRDYLDKCNRLRSNPVLFPPEQNAVIEVVAQTNTAGATIPSQNRPEQVPSTSKLPASSPDDSTVVPETPAPLLPKKSTETPAPSSGSTPAVAQASPLIAAIPSATPDFQSNYSPQNQPGNPSNDGPQNSGTPVDVRAEDVQMQELVQRNDGGSPEKSKKNLNTLYAEMLSSSGGRRKMFEKKFNAFIRDTKDLLTMAHKLNVPHLKKHINILQSKMKDEICLKNKNVKLLKNLVNKELKLRHNLCH